ncbi:FHA domain-containing protein [Ktedonobacteria bacterium brp13]|nr:FHA domain-containing protein [Ktedonobacteria bacterium brp13]
MIACGLSLLVLFGALIWNYLHLPVQHGRPTGTAVWHGWAVLAVTLLCGCVLPLWVSCVHWLRPYATVRVALDEPTLNRSGTGTPGRHGKPPVAATVQPPRHQPGQLASFVFKDDTPWGWLEYGSGNFQGQRLALKRSVITIGRDENCDIWLDDDLVSRYHAELAWCQQQVCLTDCNSMNGVLLNGYRVQGTVQVTAHDEVQIGEQRFIFIEAERTASVLDDQYDPLSNHTWRSMDDFQMDTSSPLTAASALPRDVSETDHELFSPTSSALSSPMSAVSPIPAIDGADERTALVVRSGLLAGQCLWLNQPVMTIGRSEVCTVRLQDDSIAEVQAQLYHQPYGDYLQALTNESEVSVNNVAVQGAQLLRAGDMLRLGKVLCEYLVSDATDSGMLPSPRYAKSPSGPVPLRLPSRKLQQP